MPVESFIDLLTYTFQATVFVVLTTLLGYFIAGRTDRDLARSLPWLAKTVLAPCLVIYIIAPAEMIAFKSFWKFWPIPALALITHLASVVFGLAINRFFRAPAWLVDSLSYNNVSSIPLFTFLAYSRIENDDRGPLPHLKWRILDTSSEEVKRGLVYIVLSWWTIELARAILVPITDRLAIQHPAIVLPLDDEPNGDHERDDDENSDDHQSQHSGFRYTTADRERAQPTEDAEATESSPLLANGNSAKAGRSTIFLNHLSYLPSTLLPGMIALLVALVPPIKKAVVGDSSGWFWNVIGGLIGWIGLSFVIVDTLGAGAVLKRSELNNQDKKTIPPTLGSVMLLCLWRYFALPAISIAIVHGCQMRLPVKVFNRDPVFAYVLASTVISPPNIPRHVTPHLASIHLSVYVLYIIASVALAYGISIPGSGISFENNFDLKGALKSALGGGAAGAMAMVLQVVTLMWIRTAMNYQYRYGGTFTGTLKKLWHEGGIRRFYAGLGPALIQAPVSRFGDTAANAGIFALLATLNWPVLVKTIAASLSSALFRMTLTPIDTLKTTQQTRGGVEGLKLLKARVKQYGIGCLWWGAVATAGATFVGHYPWFGTYNYLQVHLPEAHNLVQKLLRQATIGFAASIVSDTVSNSLRVVKTYRQVHEENVSYLEAAKEVLEKEGWRGLFGRGLITRYVANGLQGILFSVLWKLFSDLIAKNGK